VVVLVVPFAAKPRRRSVRRPPSGLVVSWRGSRHAELRRLSRN
jgi:hypothetical protein